MSNSKKIEADSLSQFNIYALKHQVKGLLYPKFLELIFEESYCTVYLMYTHCFFGGKRAWFTCPLCNKRVGVLYKEYSSIGCRTCFNLTYQSQNENSNLRDDVVFEALNNLIKADELEEKIKRPFYGGKPTKKQLRLERFYFEFFQAAKFLQD